MNEDTIKVISAAEAKTLSDSADKLLSNVYDTIEAVAQEGSVKVSYNVYNASADAIKKVTDSLIDNGYEVAVATEFGGDGVNTIIRVRWGECYGGGPVFGESTNL